MPDSAIQVSDAEMAAYYKAHRDDFKRPRRPTSATWRCRAWPRPTDTAAVRARADSARQEILRGAPFAEVAGRESADSASAAKGGELGEWTKGAMDPAFDSAAFALPLEHGFQPRCCSQFGFHLIEVTSRKGNKAKGRHILFPIEVTGAHRDQLDAQADSLEHLGAERSDPAALDTVARALKLRIGHTAPVQQGTKVQLGPAGGARCRGLGLSGQAWRNQPGDRDVRSRITSSGWIAFTMPGCPRWRRSVPRSCPPAREQKKWAAARQLAKDYLKRVEGGSSHGRRRRAAMKLPHREFGPFSRINPPLTNPVVVGTAFGLKAGERSGVLDTKDGIYVMETLQHIKADSAKFAKELEQYRARLINVAKQERVRNYLTALRKAAKIVDNRAKVLQQAGRRRHSRRGCDVSGREAGKA